jgi:hypothetical protein
MLTTAAGVAGLDGVSCGFELTRLVFIFFREKYISI